MNKILLIVLIVIGAICLICGGSVAALFFMGRGFMAGPMQCGFILGPAHAAIVSYATKNGKLPSAENWQLSLAEFLPRQNVDLLGMRIPTAEEVWVCNPSDPETGIAFNSDLAGKSWAELPRTAVILFEVPKTGMNLSMPYKPLPHAESPRVGGTPRGWFKVTKAGVESTPPVGPPPVGP